MFNVYTKNIHVYGKKHILITENLIKQVKKQRKQKKVMHNSENQRKKKKPAEN